MDLAENEYRCERCDQVFLKGWSDAEAEAEAERDPFGFQKPPPDDPFGGEMATVCSDCFREIRNWVIAHGGVDRAMACLGCKAGSCDVW